MKLKTVDFERVEEITEIELPAYFYFQDEDCFDELIMVTEKEQITVKYECYSVKIESTNCFQIPKHYLNNLTSKDHFMLVYNDALNAINKSL